MKYSFLVIISALGGVVISFINYQVLKSALKGASDKRAFYISPLRSILAAAYLFTLYFFAEKTNVSAAGLLIGGAIGLTFSLFVFTRLLLKGQKDNNDNTENKE
ncbi:MAG: hypothetical protein IKF53_06035 [Clostridia bacterium]|nr:hypothetical protein [Clostridia bacterium]